MKHGALGKASHECKMLLWKPYGKWLLGRDKEGRKNIVPISSTCLCLVYRGEQSDKEGETHICLHNEMKCTYIMSNLTPRYEY
jgi:hypothetical protein